MTPYGQGREDYHSGWDQGNRYDYATHPDEAEEWQRGFQSGWMGEGGA